MIRGIGRVKQVYRRMKSRYVPIVLILLYHRVAVLPTDPQLLTVAPEHFAEHLEILSSHAYPIPLRQLVNGLKEGNIPNRGVVVTFDDGYVDNLECAKPILERYGIPATVFVSAGEAGKDRPYWWDELEALLLRSGKLPETLQLKVNGDIMAWELGETAVYHEQDYWKNRGWNIIEKNDPSPRHSIYRSLCQLLRTLPSEEQQKILEDLSTWAGDQPLDCDDYLRLAPSEIKSLAKGGLVEIGAHTVTHPVLSLLSYADQKTEIQQNKQMLENILGYPVTSFAYPYGTKTDYTIETIAMVRKAGFTCACSNFPEVIWNGADPFQLPRIIVRDWDGDTFARNLKSWWGG
jgi:peptidoglycan/xylan/chitin deacetylase (PgdA/CDA1 family)